MQAKIAGFIETAMSRAIGSMTGREFAVTLDEGGVEPPPLENAIVWQQAFSIPEGPSFWVAAGRDLWEALGRITLEAAGIDEIGEEDCRSTWQEILNQGVAGVAGAITVDQGREITASQGQEIDAEPPGAVWLPFYVREGGAAWQFKAAWIPELGGSVDSSVADVDSAPARERAVSKTFDLLLEVALPVAVSFGRTSLRIREVLKLNTGSIVELDRFVSDPVEVIVNDCVIARGEVVVVDGNYGVRISQLASREDRLRSGIAEAAHRGGRV